MVVVVMSSDSQVVEMVLKNCPGIRSLQIRTGR